MDKVIRYRSNSGRVFDTEVEALHDEVIDALSDSLDKSICFRDTCADDIATWIFDHKREVLSALGHPPPENADI